MSNSLTGCIVDAAEHDEGNGRAFMLQQGLYVLLPDGCLRRARLQFNQRLRRIESMKAKLRFDSVTV